MSSLSSELRMLAVAVLATGMVMRPYPAVAQEAEASGLVEYISDSAFDETVSRIEASVTGRGLFVMRVMDHAGAAAQFGRELNPNTVALFGNPNVGSQIMACAPASGIDLPQKLLVHEDSEGSVHVSYNDPAWLKQRHAIDGCDEILGRVRQTLDSIAREVAGVAAPED